MSKLKFDPHRFTYNEFMELDIDSAVDYLTELSLIKAEVFDHTSSPYPYAHGYMAGVMKSILGRLQFQIASEEEKRNLHEYKR